MIAVSSQGPKQQLFEQFALIAKTLGHAHRLALIEHLAQGAQSVEVLAQKTGLSVANTSQHLQQLRRAGLAATKRDGKFIYYRLADPAVLDLLAALHLIGERNLAEVQAVLNGYFHDRDAMEAISRTELLKRSRAGMVTILDVRPPDEFALSHVAGAINIPIGDLEGRIAELDPSIEIIAYCRGPYCIFSFEAVCLLRKRGFLIQRLADGMPEWEAANLPVEFGPSLLRSNALIASYTSN
jgi:rhodanese-related sulfurtransferase/DNA-binding transcriptional ArsR family regulator